MKIYQFRSTQNLPVSINSAWEFFSDPRNLPKITPLWLNFEITSRLDDKMYAGMIITYSVRPLFNVAATWVTEITYMHKPFYFVDEQRFGPFKLWHHQHIFKEFNDGVEMQDIVSYAIPFGFLGTIIKRLVVERKIKEIFEFRNAKLVEIFGS